MVTFVLLLWLIPIALNVWADADGRKPNYLVMFLLRGGAALIHAIILDGCVGYFPDNLYQYSGWSLFYMWLPILLFQTTSFWLIFELALNVIRSREIFYFDRTERDSGWIDKFFDKLGSGAHFVAKMTALLLMIISIIVIYVKA